MKRFGHKITSQVFAEELARIFPTILREFGRRQQNFFSKIALTLPQIVVLELLQEQGPCRMNELAKRLNFTMSAVTAIVDKMVELSLVKRERISEDRRVVKVTILQKGMEMVRRVRELRCGWANEMFATLTEKDKHEYLRILRKVYNSLRERQ